MSTALTHQQARQLQSNPKAQITSLSTFLKARKDFIGQVVAKHMDSERMVRLALIAVQSSPDLLLATHESILACLMDCARLGLEPTGAGGMWIIPFRRYEYEGKGKSRKRTGRFTVEATALTDYRGELALARRGGELKDISAHAVYEKDTFRLVYGDEERLTHEPVLFGAKGQLQGVYAVARLKSGGLQRAFLNLEQVEARRQRSRAKDSGPWVTDFEKMALKTAIREALNLCPMSVEYREWVEREESRELTQRTPQAQDAPEITVREVTEEPEPEATPARPRSAQAAKMAEAMKAANPEPAPEPDAPAAEGAEVIAAAQTEAPPVDTPSPEADSPAEPAAPDEGPEAFADVPEPSGAASLDRSRGELLAAQRALVDAFDGDQERARALWGRFLAVSLEKVENVAQATKALSKAKSVAKRAALAVEIEGLVRDLSEHGINSPELPPGFERDWNISRLEGTARERRERLAAAKAEG